MQRRPPKCGPRPRRLPNRCRPWLRDQVLLTALKDSGQAKRAAELAWKAALGAKVPAQRQQLLLLYVQAAVAAGQEVRDRAEAAIDEGAGGTLHSGGQCLGPNRQGAAALAVVEAVPAGALVNDAQAAGEMAWVMANPPAAQADGGRQAARCREVAAEYAAAAQRAKAAKKVPQAAGASQAGGRLPGVGQRSPEVRRTLQHPPLSRSAGEGPGVRGRETTEGGRRRDEGGRSDQHFQPLSLVPNPRFLIPLLPVEQ